MIRVIKLWGGNPIVEHRALELTVRRIIVRLWLRPFTRPYRFSTYGPLCIGVAWLSAMIFAPKARS
jgi:hypothetical protein